MKNRARIWWVLVAAAALAACSSIPRSERDREALDRYMDYAGQPVSSFNYFGRFDGFQPLSQYQLVVFTSVNEAYLLTLAPPCQGLQFANGVGFSSTAHTVYRGFDSVYFEHERCMISEIRPVDYKSLKQARREEKAEAKAQESNQASKEGT
jgi:hypothetical protein